MILQGNQRGGARDLALHLLKEENDHVEVHELRGFVSNDLVSALNEAHAISRGTKAKQFLYSLSLNPPANQNVSTADFETAINRVENKLGLSGQPRAIVFHEKTGTDGQPRRHCHTVWSRIDAQNMKAIPLPHTKYKLKEISRELYLEHGWDMPRGFQDTQERDPKNFTLAQWQQAKRTGKDPRAIKSALRDSWAASDTQRAFQQALKERGFTLAKGDRRGYVAIDHKCEIYSIPKWLGVRTKDVRSRIVDQDSLPSVNEAKQQISRDMASRLSELKRQQGEAIKERLRIIEEKRLLLAKQQTTERNNLRIDQERRWATEVKIRQERFSKGLRGLLDRISGQHKALREQNERETILANLRDQKERDAAAFRQIEERRNLQARTQRLEMFNSKRQNTLSKDIQQYKEIGRDERDVYKLKQRLRSLRNNRQPERER